MILLDTLLVGPLAFVLRRIAEAVDAELNDEGAVRDDLLAAQMRLELGEISEDEFVHLERQCLARLRALREAAGDTTPGARARVAGVEVTARGAGDAPDAGARGR